MDGSDPDTVYASGPLPPQQKKFPARYRHIHSQRRQRHQRRQRSVKPANLSRQQSTLTQLDFCTPTPGISVGADDDIEDDSYVPSTRGRKRRKVREQQTTLTQLSLIHI